MALEFKLQDKDNGSELFLSAQNTKGDRVIWFTFVDKDGNKHDFDVIHQDELIEFALFINQKLGFELCSEYNIKRVNEEDSKEELVTPK